MSRRSKTEVQIMRHAAKLLNDYASSIRSEYEGCDSFTPGGYHRAQYSAATLYAKELLDRIRGYCATCDHRLWPGDTSARHLCTVRNCKCPLTEA